MRGALFLLVVPVVVMASPAVAQTVVDASGKSIPEKIFEQAREALGNEYKDPVAIQMRKLKKVDYQGRNAICFEMNAKNSYGGYIGFRPAMYVEDAKSVVALQMNVTPGTTITVENAMGVLTERFRAEWMEAATCIPPGYAARVGAIYDRGMPQP